MPDSIAIVDEGDPVRTRSIAGRLLSKSSWIGWLLIPGTVLLLWEELLLLFWHCSNFNFHNMGLGDLLGLLSLVVGPVWTPLHMALLGYSYIADGRPRPGEYVSWLIAVGLACSVIVLYRMTVGITAEGRCY